MQFYVLLLAIISIPTLGLFIFSIWMWYLETAIGKLRFTNSDATFYLTITVLTIIASVNQGSYGKYFIFLPFHIYFLGKAFMIMIQERTLKRHFKITKEFWVHDIYRIPRFHG